MQYKDDILSQLLLKIWLPVLMERSWRTNWPTKPARQVSYDTHTLRLSTKGQTLEKRTDS